MNPVFALGWLGGILAGMKQSESARVGWRRIIEQHETSGLSVAAFCRRMRVPQASFYAWRRKLREAVGFAEVRIAPESASPTGAIELRLPGQRCIVLRPGFDRQTLLDLLATLEARG